MFNCTRQNYDGIDEGAIEDMPDEYCGEYDEGHELASGEFPKQCLSDDDCLTKSGLHSECRCGLDGYYYCVPLSAYYQLDGYSELCADKKNMTNDARISGKAHAYYNYYALYYVEVTSAPDCLADLLLEFEILEALEDFMNGASWLCVGLLWLLL